MSTRVHPVAALTSSCPEMSTTNRFMTDALSAYCMCVCCVSASQLVSTSPIQSFRQRGLDPIKLAYNPCRPDGWLTLTASTFNKLMPVLCPQSSLREH